VLTSGMRSCKLHVTVQVRRETRKDARRVLTTFHHQPLCAGVSFFSLSDVSRICQDTGTYLGPANVFLTRGCLFPRKNAARCNDAH
jgi:hypothetical protein